MVQCLYQTRQTLTFAFVSMFPCCGFNRGGLFRHNVYTHRPLTTKMQLSRSVCLNVYMRLWIFWQYGRHCPLTETLLHTAPRLLISL